MHFFLPLILFSYFVPYTFRKVINRSSKYKNRYVHRRDSMSLAALSLDDRDKLARIGVVTHASSDGQDELDEEEDLEVVEEVGEIVDGGNEKDRGHEDYGRGERKGAGAKGVPI